MGDRRSSTSTRLRRGALIAGLLVLLVLALAPASAWALSGRVGPPSGAAPVDGAGMRQADGWVMYGIWDARVPGSLTYTMTDTNPEMTLVARDGVGTPAWTVTARDVSAASGKLPAALVALFDDPDPNVLRSGKLKAYNADGTVRFSKSFTDKFVEPLCMTDTRLVWVEVSARGVTRVFVRQGSTTRSLALPYRRAEATFTAIAASSSKGNRLVVGTYAPLAGDWRVGLCWVRVSRTGIPSIVSRGKVSWQYLALSPDGSRAAVFGYGGPSSAGRCLWVSFGKFGGQQLPGDPVAIGEMNVSSQRIFQQGGYSYASDLASWCSYSVAVVDWSMQYVYQRAWVWEREDAFIWFRHDPGIRLLAGVDKEGGLVSINVGSWAIAPVAGTYADAVPLADGRLMLMSSTGVVSFIANPVAGT